MPTAKIINGIIASIKVLAKYVPKIAPTNNAKAIAKIATTLFTQSLVAQEHSATSLHPHLLYDILPHPLKLLTLGQ